MCELNALEKNTVVCVGVLFGVNNVSTIVGHPARHIGHDPRRVGAGDEKNRGSTHSGGDDGNRTHDPLLAKQVL